MISKIVIELHSFEKNSQKINDGIKKKATYHFSSEDLEATVLHCTIDMLSILLIGSLYSEIKKSFTSYKVIFLRLQEEVGR